MEFAIFSPGRATTRMTDQFISSVKICPLHIREVKCNVTLHYRYTAILSTKQKLHSCRDRDREIESEGQSSIIHYIIHYASICYTAWAA